MERTIGTRSRRRRRLDGGEDNSVEVLGVCGYRHDTYVGSSDSHLLKASDCVGNNCAHFRLRDIGLRMRLATGREFPSSTLETLDHRYHLVHDDDVPEGRPTRRRGALERLDEVRAPEVLRNHDIVPGGEMFTDQSQGEGAGNQLRFLVLRPTAQRHSKAVDLDQQRQRVVVEVSAGDGRLPHTRRAVDQDQASDVDILPRADQAPRR